MIAVLYSLGMTNDDRTRRLLIDLWAVASSRGVQAYADGDPDRGEFHRGRTAAFDCQIERGRSFLPDELGEYRRGYQAALDEMARKKILTHG